MNNIKVVKNEDKNGIELYFESKPQRNILDLLKENGFRWGKYNKCWYAKESVEILEFIKTLTTGDIEIGTPTTPKQNSLLDLYNRCQFGRVARTKEEKTSGNRFEGINYTTYDLKEIAKSIRQNLKERFKECKFSVRMSKGGGSSLYVELKESPYENLDNPFGRYDKRFEYEQWQKENNLEVQAILKYCEDLCKSYNYDNSDLMSDYHSTNFYQHISICYDYKQIDLRGKFKDVITEFRNRLEEQKKIEEQEQQEQMKQREIEEEESQKKSKIREEQRKIEIENIKENVTEKELSQNELYIIKNVEFPTLDKLCSIDEYKETVAEYGINSQDTIITHELHFKTQESLIDFGNNLMTDFDFLSGKGGARTEDPRIQSMEDFYKMTEEERKTVKWFTLGIAVYYNNDLKYILNPEGQSYSRCLGFVNDSTKHKPETPKKQEEDPNVAELENISFNIIADNFIETKEKVYQFNSQEQKQYKKLLLSQLKENGIILTKELIQKISKESPKLKTLMYQFLNTCDTVIEQFKEIENSFKEGDKLTIIDNGAFGVSVETIIFSSLEYKDYAQYTDNVNIIYKKPRKRNAFKRALHGEGIMILKGVIDMPEELFVDTEKHNGYTSISSKFGSFDKRYWDIAIEYLIENDLHKNILVNTVKPIFN